MISDGLIREVGPTRRLDNLNAVRGADEINASGRIVLPGFVDSHTHLVSGPLRLNDYEMRLAGASHDDIAQAGGGYPAIYKALQDVPVKTLESQAWRILQDCIRQGSTTLEAKSGYGVTETGELKILRTHAALNERIETVVSTFMVGRILPPEFPDREAYADQICRNLLPLVHRRKLADFVDVICEEDMFTVEQAGRILETARSLGFGLKMHTAQHWRSGGIKLGVELGAVSVDHAIYLEASDIEALAQSNTIATLLPGSVFYLGHQRYASARTMIDRGVAVALATNFNPQTSPTHNMQMILSLACRKMNMTPAEAISAATINGAHAVRRGDRIGSLEFGKQADLIILNVSDYREIPYHFGVNLVRTAIKRGRVVYEASEVKCQNN